MSEQESEDRAVENEPTPEVSTSGSSGGDSSGAGSELSAEVRNWGMACHLSALIGFIVPFGSIAGPLVVWLIKREESEFIDAQGKEALNFQITVAIAVFVSIILMMVLIGILLLAIVGIGALILTIIAGLKASNGEYYRYPFTLRLIK